jgi:hypothetical protein
MAKFCADQNFIYITTHRDENNEKLHSYYKLTDEDMEEITKEWLTKFLVLVDDAELSEPDIIGNPLVTRAKHVRQTSAKKKKKKEEMYVRVEKEL